MKRGALQAIVWERFAKNCRNHVDTINELFKH